MLQRRRASVAPASGGNRATPRPHSRFTGGTPRRALAPGDVDQPPVFSACFGQFASHSPLPRKNERIRLTYCAAEDRYRLTFGQPILCSAATEADSAALRPFPSFHSIIAGGPDTRVYVVFTSRLVRKSSRRRCSDWLQNSHSHSRSGHPARPRPARRT